MIIIIHHKLVLSRSRSPILSFFKACYHAVRKQHEPNRPHAQASQNAFKYTLPEAYLHARLSECNRGERVGSLRRFSLVMPIPFSKFNLNILWRVSCMRLVIPHSTVCPPFFHANHRSQTPLPRATPKCSGTRSV